MSTQSEELLRDLVFLFAATLVGCGVAMLGPDLADLSQRGSVGAGLVVFGAIVLVGLRREVVEDADDDPVVDEEKREEG